MLTSYAALLVTSTDLVAVPADTHEKVVGLNITMNEVLVVNVFDAANHLHIIEALIRQQTSTKQLIPQDSHKWPRPVTVIIPLKITTSNHDHPHHDEYLISRC